MGNIHKIGKVPHDSRTTPGGAVSRSETFTKSVQKNARRRCRWKTLSFVFLEEQISKGILPIVEAV